MHKIVTTGTVPCRDVTARVPPWPTGLYWVEFSSIPAEILLPERPVVRGQTKYSPLVLQLGGAPALQVGSLVKGFGWEPLPFSCLGVGALAVPRPLSTMTSTTNGNTILHRSLRTINRPSLSVPVGRAGFEKLATAHDIHLLFHLPFPSIIFPSLKQLRAVML